MSEPLPTLSELAEMTAGEFAALPEEHVKNYNEVREVYLASLASFAMSHADEDAALVGAVAEFDAVKRTWPGEDYAPPVTAEKVLLCVERWVDSAVTREAWLQAVVAAKGLGMLICMDSVAAMLACENRAAEGDTAAASAALEDADRLGTLMGSAMDINALGAVAGWDEFNRVIPMDGLKGSCDNEGVEAMVVKGVPLVWVSALPDGDGWKRWAMKWGEAPRLPRGCGGLPDSVTERFAVVVSGDWLYTAPHTLPDEEQARLQQANLEALTVYSQQCSELRCLPSEEQQEGL